MRETVLLVGGGGREHTLARAIADGIADRANADEYRFVACASNRNPGIAGLADDFEVLDETDPEAVAAYASDVGATLAVVAPDDPLAAGVVDALEEAGIYAFGPTQEAARIESDKEFQRRFMREQAIPGCPEFAVFEDTEAACEYLDTDHDTPVLKPAGLTGGKGVRIIGDQLSSEEAKAYLREHEFDRVVFEEELVGVEITLQAFVANGSVRYTPVAHDHGRAFEGDEGPNTGGMGSFTAAERLPPFVTEGEYDDAVEIMEATLDDLDEFTGVLYGQFMLTSEGPKVVEYNARFGDPEAMNTLPVLETNFLDVLEAAKAGDPLPELSVRPQATVCKYAVPEGYPTDPSGGSSIEPAADHDGVQRFWASVDASEDGIVTTTSRSFAYVGFGDSIEEAERRVDEAFAETDLSGLRVRHDIARPELVRDRIDRMEAVRAQESD